MWEWGAFSRFLAGLLNDLGSDLLALNVCREGLGPSVKGYFALTRVAERLFHDFFTVRL